MHSISNTGLLIYEFKVKEFYAAFGGPIFLIHSLSMSKIVTQ